MIIYVKVYCSLLYHLYSKQLVALCDCPCDDLVDYETPKMISMALSYIAQAVVVTIVGLNLGLRFVRVSPEGGGDGMAFVQGCNTQNGYYRKANLDIWKKLLNGSISFLFWIGKKTSIYGGSFLGQGRAVPV